jgi:hypothetical protein
VNTLEPVWYLRSLPYSTYRQSAWWQYRRAQFRAWHQTDACDLCGMQFIPGRYPFDTELIPLRFHVHHSSYASLGEESNEDLRLLCVSCHNLVHFPDSHAAQAWVKCVDAADRDEFIEQAARLRPVQPVCIECELGGGEHTADCSRAKA